MLKLFVMIGAFLMLALAVRGIRHHRFEVTSETVRLHDQIRERERTILDQRVPIAKNTNPLALAANLKAAGMNAGEAMQPRETRRNRQSPAGATPGGAIETDLVAPLRRH